MTMRRRTFIGSLLASSVSTLGFNSALAQSGKPHIAVVGAGAFGGWTALKLLRSGARVTLLDAWGPGNSRSSSGGESRVIRHSYNKAIYVDMVKRSLELWHEASERWDRPLLHVSGVLHMRRSNSPISLDGSAFLMTAASVPFEMLSHDKLTARYPQINAVGIESAMYEPTGGYLLARRACQAVVDAFMNEGGEYRRAWVKPGKVSAGRMARIDLSDGSNLSADQFVFACGPWLKTMFPEVLGPHIKISRQEMFYFGTPADDNRFDAGSMPAWTDLGDEVWYGVPGGEQRGFKVADDARGPKHDPSTTERVVSADGIRAAAEYVAYRFPGLYGAPLIESRVCQYANTPDGDFIADRHPEAENAWLLGGGSGHGFKHGPALGEMVAAQVLGESPIEQTFSLSRFEA
jgi:glycine/D-amino acid oxidase-like deaminating enzyme